MTTIPERFASRIIVLDAEQSILLLRYDAASSTQPSFWVPPGGALEAGESHRQAAQRELLEETCLDTPVGSQLREYRFEFHLDGEPVRQAEQYFRLDLAIVAPSVQNTSPEPILGYRWWSLVDLRSTDQTVYPEDLVDRLDSLIGDIARRAT